MTDLFEQVKKLVKEHDAAYLRRYDLYAVSNKPQSSDIKLNDSPMTFDEANNFRKKFTDYSFRTLEVRQHEGGAR